MAHTDSCKIQVCQFVEKLTANGMGLNQACKETEKESDGIPEGTIKRWWYEIKKTTEEQFKNELPATPPTTPSNDTEITNNQVKRWKCDECGEEFHLEFPVAHCKGCDHHYPKSDGICSNCDTSLYHCKETRLIKDSPGGHREGAGRKVKYVNKPITAEDKVNIQTLYPMTSNFGKAYDNMIYAIKGEKEKDWAEMSQNSILWHLETLILLAKGESLCGM